MAWRRATPNGKRYRPWGPSRHGLPGLPRVRLPVALPGRRAQGEPRRVREPYQGRASSQTLVFSGFSAFFAGERCILAQQASEDLLQFRSGERAEPAMSNHPPLIEHDSIGQSAKAVSQAAHQLDRASLSCEYGISDAVGLGKFLDF